MSTPTQVLNQGLLKIGVSQTIVDLAAEATREAATANLIYAPALKETLQAYTWNFATRYADLYLTAGPFWDTDPTVLTLVQAWSSSFTYAVGDVARRLSVNYYCILAHTNQQPPNATYWSTAAADAPDYANRDWLYAYRTPSDSLKVRRLVPVGGYGRQFSDTPIRFRTGQDDNGSVIYTHEQDAHAEYTVFVQPSATFTDPLFEDALSWKFAERFAPSLARDAKTVQWCAVQFERAIMLAHTQDAREQQQDPPGDAEHIRAR